MNNALDRMKAAANVHHQIGEVLAGVRGFISCNSVAKSSGFPKDSIAKWATAAGLIGKNHGRYGLCFSRPA